MAAALPFRDINVHASPSHYAFSSPSTPNAPTLVVDRPSGDLRLHNGKLVGTQRVTSIAGILGIISLRLDKYIITITKAQPVGRLKGHMVYKIAATEFLPLRERPLHDPDEDTYLSYVKTLLKQGPMYFSYSMDLTNSFQRQSESNIEDPLWKRADDRFFWNRFVQADLIDLRSGGAKGFGSRGTQPGVDPYILPVMFGMMEIRNTSIKGQPLTFILITRRSRHRAGTRYFSRGIDENGNVSNFNETEQAVILNDNSARGMGAYAGSGAVHNGTAGGNQEAQVLSYVQTRGSVPVYWAEINTLKYTPKLQVRGVESAVQAARKHFDDQIRLYGDNWLVNLVNQKGRERSVKEAYEQMVQYLVSSPESGRVADRVSSEKFVTIEPGDTKKRFDRLHYVYFDFHNETRGLQWHRALLLMEQLRNPVVEGGYFSGVDIPADPHGRLHVLQRQSCVVRTNCMDCLDRTNVVQSMLGRFMLSHMLVEASVLRQGEKAEDDRRFEFLFRNVWADNADVVSKSYSGTGALKTDFTRTGERTKKGMLADLSNSTTRYMKNNFGDGPRQDAFDLFLGRYLPSGTAHVFIDRRPLLIQAIPYILAFSIFFVLVGSFTRRDVDAGGVWPLRLLMIAAFGVAVACLQFIGTHGTLYVNWPKLNTPPYATEGYQEALTRVQHTPVVGQFVRGRHERGKSDARLGFMEEGKKRIE